MNRSTMGCTREQLRALNTAIAAGSLSVQYGDCRVTYRSLEELESVRDMVAADLGRRRRFTDGPRDVRWGLILVVVFGAIAGTYGILALVTTLVRAARHAAGV